MTHASQSFGDGLDVSQAGVSVPQLHSWVSEYGGIESFLEALVEYDVLTIQHIGRLLVAVAVFTSIELVEFINSQTTKAALHLQNHA